MLFIGQWYDNTPDEPAIWFEQLYAKEDKQGNMTIYAACRITFDGNNTRSDEQRTDPKISNIEFIFEKDKLGELVKHLKTLPISQ